ncbi:hypothetical protein AAUPMC_12546, partial [Pasteurella multocida subsp. multocida str. Anand1_cattle]
NNPNLVGKGNSTDEVNAYRSALRREIENINAIQTVHA